MQINVHVESFQCWKMLAKWEWRLKKEEDVLSDLSILVQTWANLWACQHDKQAVLVGQVVQK